MHTPQFQLHAEIEERHWWFLARRQIMRRLVNELLPPSPQTVVVDVGCGTGANLAALANQYTCVGIDTSAEAIAAARQRFTGPKFLVGYAPADLGVWMNRAKLIMLMDVLEHVEDDFTLFSELLAAAAPGTHFLLTVPADPSLWSEHDESFGHYRRYDQARLERLWDGLPVTPLAVSYFSSRLLPLVKLVRWRNRRRGRASGRAGTDFWLPYPVVNRTLQTIMAGEAGRLASMLHGRSHRGFSAGSSLIALLHRDAGEIPLLHKPVDLLPDHQPALVGA